MGMMCQHMLNVLQTPSRVLFPWLQLGCYLLKYSLISHVNGQKDRHFIQVEN